MSKDIKACLSHNTDNWKTPKWLYDLMINFGYLDTFPFLSQYNEFEKTYFNKKLYCNPPFSKLDLVSSWIKKQVENGCSVVLLLPSRTDTNYFHDLTKLNPLIIFIKGRLHFNDSKNGAPFPTILMIFNSNYKNDNKLYLSMSQEDLRLWLQM